MLVSSLSASFQSDVCTDTEERACILSKIESHHYCIGHARNNISTSYLEVIVSKCFSVNYLSHMLQWKTGSLLQVENEKPDMLCLKNIRGKQN